MLYQLALLLLAAVALSGCEQPVSGVLRFGLQAAPITLDPRVATDATSARMNRLLYRSLVDFDERFAAVPALASWQVLSPTHYRFMLEQTGRRFHDGQRLTAYDVKATYESILDPATASPHRSSLSRIAAIDVIDDDTLDFHLSEPDAFFLGRLAIGIVPAHLAGPDTVLAREPVGSGPFRFVAWPQEESLQLARVADGQVFEFLRIGNPTVRVLKLLRGEIDMMQNDLAPELIDYLSQQDEVQVQLSRGSNFTYLGFNMAHHLTGRLAVRRAIAHAIDRAAIIRYVLADAARPAAALLTPEHWAGAADLTAPAFDPDRARRLLATALPHEQGTLRISYKTSSDPLRLRIATVIQQQLREVGIRLDLRSYDWGTFYGDIKRGNFEMFSLSWVGIKSPDIFDYVFHSRSVPPNGANRGRYQSARADELIQLSQAAPDADRQAGLLRDLQRHLIGELPYVPLWYEDHVFVARRDIEGYELALDGNYDGLTKVRRRLAVAGSGL